MTSVFTVIAQTNLVPNPSFEDVTGGNYCESAGDWSSVISWKLPDGGNTCGPGTADYRNSICGGNNSARNGTGWAFCFIQPDQNYYEYITQELSSTLIVGRKYYVSFYVQSLSNSGNTFGAILTSTRPNQLELII